MKLDQIRALIEAATPGPWKAEGTNLECNYRVSFIMPARTDIKNNVAFIAASRTLMPKLLECVLRADDYFATLARGDLHDAEPKRLAYMKDRAALESDE